MTVALIRSPWESAFLLDYEGPGGGPGMISNIGVPIFSARLQVSYIELLRDCVQTSCVENAPVTSMFTGAVEK